MIALGHDNWSSFKKVIDKAMAHARCSECRYSSTLPPLSSRIRKGRIWKLCSFQIR